MTRWPMYVLLTIYTHCIPGHDQIAASTSSKPSAPATGPRLAHKNPRRCRESRPSCVRATAGLNGTQLDLSPPPRSGYPSMNCGNAGSRGRLHGSRTRTADPGRPVPQAADQARSGPQLAHSHRERSAEPLPDTHQTRHPGTPAPGLTWGFEWQVLGSNQRRLSRRFYRTAAFLPIGMATDLPISPFHAA